MSNEDNRDADHWLYKIIPTSRAKAHGWRLLTWNLFGNDEDGIFWPKFGKWGQFVSYSGDPSFWNFLRWWVRNPFHNLYWHTLRWPWPQHEANALVFYDTEGGFFYHRPHTNWIGGENKDGFQFELLPFYISWHWGYVEGYFGWKLDFGAALRK